MLSRMLPKIVSQKNVDPKSVPMMPLYIANAAVATMIANKGQGSASQVGVLFLDMIVNLRCSARLANAGQRAISKSKRPVVWNACSFSCKDCAGREAKGDLAAVIHSLP